MKINEKATINYLVCLTNVKTNDFVDDNEQKMFATAAWSVSMSSKGFQIWIQN